MSLANLGVPLGTMSASVVLLVMSKTFTTSGWRVAMLLSVVILIPALLARYKFADSPLFEQVKQTDKLTALPSFGVLKHYPRSVILLALFVAFSGMSYVSQWVLALAYTGLRETELALRALAQSIAAHSPQPAMFMSSEPRLDCLRSERRFRRMESDLYSILPG
jgi:hypothetical protein